MMQVSYEVTQKMKLESQLVVSEAFPRYLKTWKICIASLDDRAYKFWCVCFKTQSHFFRDLNWPTPRPALATEMCFIWLIRWFNLKLNRDVKIRRFQVQIWFSCVFWKIWSSGKTMPTTTMTVPSWSAVQGLLIKQIANAASLAAFILCRSHDLWLPSIPLCCMLF